MVNFDEEVVVVTGGRKGLGCCLAEIYAMKGAGVAVLEKHGRDGDEEEDGIRRFKCDVGNREEVESVWRRVVKEVSCGSSSVWYQPGAWWKLLHRRKFEMRKLRALLKFSLARAI